MIVSDVCLVTLNFLGEIEVIEPPLRYGVSTADSTMESIFSSSLLPMIGWKKSGTSVENIYGLASLDISELRTPRLLGLPVVSYVCECVRMCADDGDDDDSINEDDSNVNSICFFMGEGLPSESCEESLS